MSFWQFFYSVGAFIAYWVAYACAKHKATLGNWDWKMVVIFQMLVPLIIITQIPFLPETPRVSKTTSCVQLYPVFLSFYNGLADSQSLVVYPAWQPHRRRTRLPPPSPSFRTRHRGRTPHYSRSYRLWKRGRLWLLFSLMERSLGAQEALACIRRHCRSAALWTGDLESVFKARFIRRSGRARIL
jgi:MFS family permease